MPRPQLSPKVQKIMEQNRKKMRQTNTLVSKLKQDAPVLSTILDYGGQSSSIDEVLRLDSQDQKDNNYNNFEKILIQSRENSSDHNRSKKYLSFIEYKAQPSKANLTKHKKSKKSLRSSIVVQMPQELQSMKNQILSLPSVNQSRFVTQKPSVSGSRLLDQLKRIHQRRRYSTEHNEQQSVLNQGKKQYLQNLQDILSKFQSPQIHCNSHFLTNYENCKKLLNQQQSILKQYKKFQSLGSPPKKIIRLNNLLTKFEKNVDKSLDSQLSRQINNMDSKRYDIVLKHEEQTRRFNLIKFQEKKKQQKIQQCKNPFSEFIQKPDKLGFKLNSKGKQIYTNRLKTVK